ncbi:MAG TPA: hypothetical protein VGH20_00870 [Myxococcales bacterium]|jgi:hypothetical protein
MRVTKWLMVAALFAVAPACKNENGSVTGQKNNEQTDQVKSAQQNARDGFKKAEDAQKNAMKQEDQAKSAQSDVQKAQQDLQQKEQKAQQAESSAQQAQAQAQQQGQAAQQTASASQQQAAQALTQEQQQQAQQQKQAAQTQQASADQRSQTATAATSGQEVTGKLAQASDTQLRIDSLQQPLKIDSSTQVTLDGQPSSAAQLQPGSEVRASYRPDGTAIKVDAKSAQK